MEHEVYIEAEVETPEAVEEQIRRSVLAALEEEQVDVPCIVAVCVTDDAGIHQTNLEMRGVDRPTDVLSFECDNIADDMTAADGEGCPVYELGDIIIAPDVAATQAEEYGNSFEQEISLLLVHGLLHLCGYDHIVDEEAEVMEAREKELLTAWSERDLPAADESR